MKNYVFLFLFLILGSSVFAISQEDINTINRMNSKENIIIAPSYYNDLVSPQDVLLEDKEIISDIHDVDVISTEINNGIIYSDYTTVRIVDSNVDLDNIGVGKGIVTIADDNINITGIIQITFYTNMPNTPFSIKHYEGVTDDKDLVQLEGNTIIPIIYSDDYGVVKYNSDTFSTQILSFPDPLVHASGGATTTYYLDYFFSSYDFVTLKQTGNFSINDSFSNSSYEIHPPTEDYVEYEDNLINVYFQGNTRRVRLVSKNYTNGFNKTITIKAANDASHAGEVSQTFTWRLNATNTTANNEYPNQIGYIPNQTITKNNRITLFFNDYYTNYTDIFLVVYNASNYTQSGNGFGQQIHVNTTLFEYQGILNSTVFLIDLNGLGNDVSAAIYTNQTENVTLDVWYTASKKNSTGGNNLLNISTFFLTISGDVPSVNNSLLFNLLSYYKLDEKTGTIAIDSQNRSNGTISGNPGNVTGKINTAYNFTNTSKISINDSTVFNTNNFTISLWVKLNGNFTISSGTLINDTNPYSWTYLNGGWSDTYIHGTIVVPTNNVTLKEVRLSSGSNSTGEVYITLVGGTQVIDHKPLNGGTRNATFNVQLNKSVSYCIGQSVKSADNISYHDGGQPLNGSNFNWTARCIYQTDGTGVQSNSGRFYQVQELISTNETPVSNKAIVDKWGNGNSWYLEQTNRTRISFIVNNASGTQATTTCDSTFSNTTFSNIIATYNSTHISLYLNGSSCGSPSAITGLIKDTNSSVIIGGDDIGSIYNGVIDEIAFYNRTVTSNEVTTLYSNSSACSYDCIVATSFPPPQQSASLPNININYFDQVYVDYTDYFTGFDRIYINFTSVNGTNVSMFALLNATYYNYSEQPFYILNLSGDSSAERLFVTAGSNSSFTLLKLSLCNHEACLLKNQTLNISEEVITDIPVQINHIDNIVMQKFENFTQNWGAYFTGYTGISISFIDTITNNLVTLVYTNTTVNYETSYLNITTFDNGAGDLNTTFQSFNTSYYTVLLISAINAYGDTGQYVAFSINYTYIPPTIEQCINASTICIFPDYQTQTQKQRNIYVILTLIVTAVLLAYVSWKLFEEIGIIYVIVTFIVFVIELIYFAKIKYLPITYIVGITLVLMVVVYLIYKKVSQ